MSDYKCVSEQLSGSASQGVDVAEREPMSTSLTTVRVIRTLTPFHSDVRMDERVVTRLPAGERGTNREGWVGW